MTDRLSATALAVMLLASGCARPGGLDTPAPVTADAVAAMLNASADAWNSGDLAGFLDDYADDATFVGASGLIRGVGELERRYRERYWGGGQPRERLRFTELDVAPLGADHALVVGRYILEDWSTGAETSTGLFSLVLVRTPAGWRILHDHSSASG